MSVLKKLATWMASLAALKGLLKAAIRDNDPVMFFEDNNLAGLRGEVSDDEDLIIPFGQAEVKREGTDVQKHFRLLKLTIGSAFSLV